jgi:hypothetical protein
MRSWPSRRFQPARVRRALFASLVLAVFCVAVAGADEIRFWVDADGITHFSDDPRHAPPEAETPESEGLDLLRSAWSDGVVGPADRQG